MTSICLFGFFFSNFYGYMVNGRWDCGEDGGLMGMLWGKSEAWMLCSS